MKINKDQIIIGLLICILLVGIINILPSGFYGKGYSKNMMNMDHKMMMDYDMNMGNMMMDMNMNLEGKTGLELEKAFLEDMIVHHEGAIDMAKTLKEGTKRPELLKMADDIINAQTKEVEQMETWLDTWFK